MASNRTESDPVLASLRAKVAAWQAAVDSYLAAKALEGTAETTSAALRGTIELPVNAFRGMTMIEAVKLFLKSVQQKQTTAEIADGLKSGGLVTTAKDITPTLRNALGKLKHDGVLLRFPDGWDLAEAHSAAIRHRITKDNAKPAKRRGRKAKASAKAKAAEPKAASGAVPPNSGETLDARAHSFLRAKPTEAFTAKQIAEGLGLDDAGKLALSLARLVRYKRAVKRDDGRYVARAA
jgi:hypothetical protein